MFPRTKDDQQVLTARLNIAPFMYVDQKLFPQQGIPGTVFHQLKKTYIHVASTSMFYLAYLLRISVRTEYEVLATRENDRDQQPVHDSKEQN